jgi:transcriptional regulator with GAF, ATPase, and Fis domain
MPREQRLTETFVELADTLVDDYDVADLLHVLADRCVELLDVTAAGLLLTDQRGALRTLAASSEQTMLLELFQLEANEGPCLDCFRSGAQVVEPDLSAAAARWPHFVTRAREQGFASVNAVPLRLRNETIGALNLFSSKAGGLSATDVGIAQALANVATIGILQERAIRRSELLAEQLQAALNSRVVIEQAKGVLAERGGLTMDQSFAQLRRFARNTNQRLSDTAQAVVSGIVDVSEIVER